jgi:N-glycosylase/DNA lyase
LKLSSVPFNLEVTLCCGQVFRWHKQGDWWYGVAADKAFKIRQVNSELEFANADEKFVVYYFGLEDDLQMIREQVGRDEHVRKAFQEFWGLRIVRQDPWECLVSYICATYKSIAAIRQMLFRLAKRFGEQVVLDGCDFYTFPSAEKLARATVDSLAACGLGYRAKYVSETAKMVCECGFDLESLRGMPYQQAKKTLQSFSGVGSKVADCVLLFSLGRFDAFPVDVWVKRALLNHYAEHFTAEFIQKIGCNRSFSNAEYERLNRFGRSYFGEYAGYAQEYLYHYERTRC